MYILMHTLTYKWWTVIVVKTITQIVMYILMHTLTYKWWTVIVVKTITQIVKYIPMYTQSPGSSDKYSKHSFAIDERK